MQLNIHLNDISETAIFTLQCHALDAKSKQPYLNDISSVHTLNLLKESYASDPDHHLYRRIVERKISSSAIAHTALRAKKYDSYIRQFLSRYPEATIVNIGCGLDDRFERIDNGQVTFLDLDLPDIMNIKKQIFPEKERYIQISRSVFDYEWMDLVQSTPVMLVAEGVFMYCQEKDVKELFLLLQQKMENPEVVFEVFSSKWLTGWRKGVTETKLKNTLKFGEGAFYQFGIENSHTMESWSPGMKLIEEWSYLDSEQINSFLLKLMRRRNSLRQVQWTVHYILGKSAVQ